MFWYTFVLVEKLLSQLVINVKQVVRIHAGIKHHFLAEWSDAPVSKLEPAQQQIGS